MLKHKYKIFLAVLILASSLVFLRNLGRPDLTMWDEVVHADVTKHLAQHCCTPTLLTQNWGTDFHDWTNTTVWLHKPLLPFYISAGFYKIHPSTLAIRLPALIAFELLLILIHFIGWRYFHPAVGLCAATLMAFNIYSFQLVQGIQFSGLGDIGFAFFVLAGVGLVLEYLKNPKAKWLAWLGLSLALAYFFKGGLVLIPFGVLGLIIIWCQEPFIFKLKKLALTGIIFIIPVGLVSLYLSKHFGAPYAYEQHMQLAHLWQNVEGWGRPWDYYLTVYWPNMLGIWLLPPFLVMLLWSVFKLKQYKNLAVLAAIIFAFFILLSFAISKVPNFIYACLPLAALLICSGVYRLWEEKKYKIITAMAISTILMYILLRFDLWFVKEYLARIVKVPERMLILEISACTLIAGLILSWLSQKNLRPLTVKVLVTVAIILVAWSNIHANLQSLNVSNPSLTTQAQIRQAANKLNASASANSAIIVDMPNLYRSNLYFEFWSNIPAVEVTKTAGINDWLKIIPPGRSIYLLNQTKVTQIR